MIFIRQGRPSVTGRWNKNQWAIHVPGKGAEDSPNLNAAKARAIELGASGKWMRSEDPVGPRGMKCVTYRDAASN